jgi:hypothetical protein
MLASRALALNELICDGENRPDSVLEAKYDRGSLRGIPCLYCSLQQNCFSSESKSTRKSWRLARSASISMPLRDGITRWRGGSIWYQSTPYSFQARQPATGRRISITPRGADKRLMSLSPANGSVASAPAAFRVGVWQIMSRGQGLGAVASAPGAAGVRVWLVMSRDWHRRGAPAAGGGECWLSSFQERTFASASYPQYAVHTRTKNH